MNNSKRSQKLHLYLCIGVISICTIGIIQTSGFRYEAKKLKQFAVTTVIVMISRYLLWEHMEYFLKSLYMAHSAKTVDSCNGKTKTRKQRPQPNKKFSRLAYLKLRLKTAKAELHLTPSHKDEGVNIEYKLLTQDLWMFSKYFLLLLMMIVYSRSSNGYYNTKIMKSILIENRLSKFGLSQMQTIQDLYRVLNGTMTQPLNEGFDYRGVRLSETGWVNYEMAKLMGVVRLQQIRLREKTDGMRTLNFDNRDYMPQWAPFNYSLHYMDKYWRIYYPWLSKDYKGVANWLMSFTHIGSLYTYSEVDGYVSLLARDQKNSEKILHFLEENSWLDSLTAAVLIDFTLYNVDANMFSIISILVEQTPFGGVVWQQNLNSVALLANWTQLSWWWWLLILLYFWQLMDFCKAMLKKCWFQAGFIQSPWDCVDFTIVLLNVLIFTLLLIREHSVKLVLASLETSNKLNYIDFRIATWFDYFATITMGFLVTLTTVRIWKLLQFSSIFRVFTGTLYSASGSLVATVCGIHIFLLALGYSAQIVNGSQTEIFSRYLKSLTSIISYSFGFNSHTSPDDLSHGGNILGFILYLILMFVVAIFLINMFITLICDHFEVARSERDRQRNGRLSYHEYLMAEYGTRILEFAKALITMQLRTKRKKSVSAEIAEKLKILDEKYEKQTEVSKTFENSDKIYEKDMLSAKRVQDVVAILQLQMEILHRKVMRMSLEWDSDEEEDSGVGDSSI